MKFIFKIKKRYEYRQLLSILKHLPEVKQYLAQYAARELLFECADEGRATLLSATLAATLKNNGIEFDMRIIKDTLAVGDIVDIYITKDDGEYYREGQGELVRFISAQDYIYPITSKCERQINVVKEKWEVKRVDDPFLKDTTFIRNIERYHSEGDIPITGYDNEDYQLLKEYCVDYLDNDPENCHKLKQEILGKQQKTELYHKFINYKNEIPNTWLKDDISNK